MRKAFTIIGKHPLLFILLLAGGIRLIFLMSYYFSPEWNHLIVDSLYHDRWAMSIAEGNLWGNEVFFRAPLYIYVLGGLYAVFGHSLFIARLFGILTGLCSICAVYLIARTAFSKRSALWAALIFALYPMTIYFESELLVESLFTCFTLFSIAVFMRAINDRKITLFIGTGLLIGLAAITRPVILGLLPLYILLIFLAGEGLKKKCTNGLALVISLALIIAPVTIRNIVVGGDFVTIASSGGINFYIGNNQKADGLSAALPEPLGGSWEIKDIKYLAENETGISMTPSGLSQFYYSKGWNWIAENKLDFIRLYFKKLYFCLNNTEISNNRNLPLFFQQFFVLKYNPLNYALVIALALLGSILLHREKRNRTFGVFLVLYVVFYFLLISLFFINARYRLPAVPLLLILGAYGIDKTISIIHDRRSRKLIIPSIIVCLGLLVFSHSNFYSIMKDSSSAGFFNNGNYYLYLDELDRAGEYYRLTLNENPAYPDANMNRGIVFLKKGMADSAGYYFNRELDYYPANARAYSNLASLSLLENDLAGAEQYARKAIELRPYFDDPYMVLIRTKGILNDSLAVADILHQAETDLDSKERVFYEAGVLFSNWGNDNKAIDYLMKSLACTDVPVEVDDRSFSYTPSQPAKAKAAYQLGYLHGTRGHLEQSIIYSERAITLDSGLSEAYINLANAYALQGDVEKARSVLIIAGNKFPDNEIIISLLNSLK